MMKLKDWQKNELKDDIQEYLAKGLIYFIIIPLIAVLVPVVMLAPPIWFARTYGGMLKEYEEVVTLVFVYFLVLVGFFGFLVVWVTNRIRGYWKENKDLSAGVEKSDQNELPH